MKKNNNLFKIILIIMILTLTSNFSYGEILENEVKVIKIGGDNNYPPYEFLDKEGKFRGFNVDIMNAIGIELGIEIDLIPMTWEQAMLNLESEDIDMVQGMTKSSYRDKLFDFSDPLIINSQAIFVKNDTNDVATLQDLTNKKVSFQKADVSMEISEKMKGIERYAMENQEKAIDLLLNGEVDAFVGNRYTGIYYLQRSNNYDKVKIVGAPMHETEYCVAVKKGNDKLLQEINHGLKEIKSSGTYDKIHNKWFGETLQSNIEELRKTLNFLFFILFLSMIILSLYFYWNKILKEKVKERTSELDIKNKEIEEQRDKIDISNILRGTILSSIVSGIIVFDKKDKVIEFNHAAEELLNINIKIGDSWKDLDIENKYKFSGYEESKLGKVIKDNKKITLMDKEKYINYNFIPITDKNMGVILLVNDYTDIENYQQMASYNEKMQALGELSGGIAHEIRNPLTSIKTFIDLIPYKINDEEFRKELVSISSKEITRINELITQLIDFTKPVERNLSDYSLEKIINEVLLLLSNTLSKNRIKLDLEIEDIIIHGDSNQVKQVLVNIILNSIESIKESGNIKIYNKINNNNVKIIIEDNGIGIPKEFLEKLYNPFFTLKPKGTGIGLAITRKIIEENNGNIIIESEEGQWTKVTITLPIK